MRPLLDNDRQREQRRQQTLFQRVARGLQRSLFAEFQRLGREAAAEFGASETVNTAIADHLRRTRELVRASSLEGINVNGRRILDATQKMRRKDATSEFERFAVERASQIAAAAVVKIGTTTRSQINAAITVALDENLPLRDVERRIQASTSGVITRARAAVIARTEIHSSVQAGNQLAVEATGRVDDFAKEWVSAEDERTRETHVDADSQTVDTREAFQVGSDKLMYPGDPSGSAREIINCRCASVVVIE